MTQLDADAVRGALAEHVQARIDCFEFFPEIGSTNTYLVEKASPAAGRFHVALADHQTSGRGRRENAWVSAPGASVCLSVEYTFEGLPANLPAIPLALGVAAGRALTSFGVNDVRLKWPNDILVADGKLGGILTESQFRGGNEVSVVAGIGINIDVPAPIAGQVDARRSIRPTGLADLLSVLPAREVLVAELVEQWLTAFLTFEQAGFESFETEYRERDWLLGKHVLIDTPDGELRGLASGIDTIGALLVEGEAGPQQVLAGTIRQVQGSGVV